MRCQLLAIACLAVSAQSISPSNHTIWTWKCQERNCIKVMSDGEEMMSEGVCRLGCGDGLLWPLPSSQQISRSVVPIDPHSVHIHSPSLKNADANPKLAELLKANHELFTEGILDLLPGHKSSGEPQSLSIKIDIAQPSIIHLTKGTNESYSLKIASATDDEGVKAHISSNNFLGARHGLETLRQLIVYDPVSKNLVIPSQAMITDSPKYGYRGILLDTARNFISVPVIKKTIEAMAANKLNSFHWHITDSQSFPMSLSSYPQMATYGAFSQEQVYSEDDIRDIVQTGLVHGVRIVPELDAPGHVGEGWQWSPSDTVVCHRAEPWQEYCVEPPCGQLNPTSPHVYSILDGIYSEMAGLFPSDIFHMGGDEVNVNCWNSSSNIVENMAKMNMGRSNEDFHKLWSDFQKKALDLVDKAYSGSQQRDAVLWTSSLTSSDIRNYLDPSRYIIQIWTTGKDKTIADLVNKGYRVILSNYDALYFDCGFGAWVGTGNNWCSPYIPWQKVYENDPEAILKSLGVDVEGKRDLVLGGEAALWSEQVDDSSVSNRLWPRAAAMAERLWSGRGTWEAAKDRMAYNRRRMMTRGFAPDTLQPRWCDQNQPSCYIK